MTIKPSEALRFLGGLAGAAAVLGLVALRVTSCAPAPKPKPPPLVSTLPPPAEPRPPTATAGVAAVSCEVGPEKTAEINARSLDTLPWSPFGRTEVGWETYAPLIGREIRTGCGPDTAGFAAALAAWEARQGLAADGVMSAAVFERLKTAIQLRRAFVQLSARRICPAAVAEGTLAQATPAEGYAGKAVLLRPAALDAYRRMAAAARAEVAAIDADPRDLTIFSGYRSPAADDARCRAERNCDGRVRAACSAHRTGLALDLYVGQAPGYGPDSSADPNRLYMSRTPAYRWLVANADRFGFTPYPFEPWHWEWTGEAP